MIKLFEELHIPDPDKLDIFIEEICEHIRYIVYKTVMNNVKSNNINPPFNVKSGVISLINIKNTPEWLDKNVNIYIDISLQKKDSFNNNDVDASFSLLKSERGNITETYNDRKYRLCDCVFNIIANPYFYKDGDDINKLFDECKDALAREIVHAYQDYSRLINGSISTFDINRSELEYSRISEKEILQELENKRSSKIYDKEYRLLFILYTLFHDEMCAMTGSFFGEIKQYDELKPITDYKCYQQYKRNIEYFKSFNDNKLFNKYKNQIINLFGNRCKNIQKFKTVMIERCEKVLSNLQDVYFREKSKLDSDVNKDDLDSQFEQYKMLYLDKLIVDLSEDEKLSYKYNFEKYIFENINIVIKGIKKKTYNT